MALDVDEGNAGDIAAAATEIFALGMYSAAFRLRAMLCISRCLGKHKVLANIITKNIFELFRTARRPQDFDTFLWIVWERARDLELLGHTIEDESEAEQTLFYLLCTHAICGSGYKIVLNDQLFLQKY